MYAALIVALASALGASAAAIAPQASTEETVQMEFTFWQDGCGNLNCGSSYGCAETIAFGPGTDGTAGDCYPAPDYHFTTAQLAYFNGASGWTVDLFTGEGCNDYTKSISVGGCYTQPEGEILLSFRANAP